MKEFEVPQSLAQEIRAQYLRMENPQGLPSLENKTTALYEKVSGLSEQFSGNWETQQRFLTDGHIRQFSQETRYAVSRPLVIGGMPVRFVIQENKPSDGNLTGFNELFLEVFYDDEKIKRQVNLYTFRRNGVFKNEQLLTVESEYEEAEKSLDFVGQQLPTN